MATFVQDFTQENQSFSQQDNEYSLVDTPNYRQEIEDMLKNIPGLTLDHVCYSDSNEDSSLDLKIILTNIDTRTFEFYQQKLQTYFIFHELSVSIENKASNEDDNDHNYSETNTKKLVSMYFFTLQYQCVICHETYDNITSLHW